MAGMRLEPGLTERLATIARAQGGRTVGGRVPGELRPASLTQHIPGRVLKPQQAGLYAPAFTVPGVLENRYYPTGLDNITGGPLTITRVSARVGTAPQGRGLVARVVMDDTDTVADVDVAENAYYGELAVSYPWSPGQYLTVSVIQVGTADPGADLVVQVLTA